MRSQIIGKFVSQLTGAWFQPPRGMEAQAQAEHVAEITKAVNRALPLSLHPEQLEDALERTKSVLMSEAKSRAWPIIREVTAAIRKSLPGEASHANDAEKQDKARAAQIEVARNWWGKFNDLPGWLMHEHVIKALIADGIPARTLWKAGIDVPRHLRDWPQAAHWPGTPRYREMGDTFVADAAE